METLSLFAIVASIVFIGFLAQWLAWRIGIPSIVFLFTGGLILGPLTGIFSPDSLFGDLLFPLVSALIGIILFEGGLTLDFEDIGKVRGTVFRIIFLGGFVTFLLTGISAYYLLEFRLDLSFLLGAILVVTGPTVVIPLLHRIRPQGNIGSIARWEGIIIDPLGAILAVTVFEVILAEVAGATHGLGMGVMKFGMAMGIGTAVGLISGYLIMVLINRYWLPDFLHNFAILATVLVAQAVANHFAHEAGLLAVTVMGMFLANQDQVAIRHILDFKEELRVLFTSALFIILVARLEPGFFYEIQLQELLFLLSLVLLIRPVSIIASTFGSELDLAEQSFLAWLAPRGIVAASMASIFSLELEKLGLAGADQLDNVTFLVIAGTVIIYGITLSPLSRFLGLSEHSPQGVLILGAHPWTRQFAKVLLDQGILVRMVDKNRNNIRQAREMGLEAYCIDVMSEAEIQALDVQGIGYFLAMTQNEEINTLAMYHARDIGFDSSETFQISPTEEFRESQNQPYTFQGRFIVNGQIHFEDFRRKFDSGWKINSTTITEQNLTAFTDSSGDQVLPLVLIRDSEVTVITNQFRTNYRPGDRAIYLAHPDFNP